MYFNSFEALRLFMAALEYGLMADVEIAIDPDEPELLLAMHSTQKPLARFASFLHDNNGAASFLTIKVQDGLPVFATSEWFYEGQKAHKNHKFT